MLNSMDTYSLEGISMNLFSSLFNAAAGESTVVRASTFLDHFSNYVKFHHEVFDKREESLVDV
jgi:hypothetical protein